MKIINEAIEAKIRDIDFVEDWDKYDADKASQYVYPDYPGYGVIELCERHEDMPEINGKYYPATQWEPAEYPEINVPDDSEIDDMAFDEWLKDFLHDNHIEYTLGKNNYIKDDVQYFESTHAYISLRDVFLDSYSDIIPTRKEAEREIDNYFAMKEYEYSLL